ncbi:MAG: hypothetical protein Q9226_000196 [Calogaya cf. arnoldii]
MRSYFLGTLMLALPFITAAFTHATSELHQRDGDMTIAVTNHYGTPLQLSFNYNKNPDSPLFRGNPQPTTLDKDATITYAAPPGWAGRIQVGKVDNSDNSKIEGSFYGAGNGAIDISYVDGYSVPITCSAGGKVVSGCNIELWVRECIASDSVGEWGPDGKPALCRNGARESNRGPPSSFFSPCAGAAYTFPFDDMATLAMIRETQISCCIGTSCDPSPRQHKRDLSNVKANAPSLMPRQHKQHRQSLEQ